jgi:hypothetical protein
MTDTNGQPDEAHAEMTRATGNPCAVAGCSRPAVEHVFKGGPTRDWAWLCSIHRDSFKAEAAARADANMARLGSPDAGLGGMLMTFAFLGCLAYGGWWLLRAGYDKANELLNRDTACRLERIDHPVYGPQLQVVNAAGDVVMPPGQGVSQMLANVKCRRWATNEKGEWKVRYKGHDFWLSDAEMVNAVLEGRGEMAFP